ncbi:MAG: hypothetical protein RLZZ444_686, partial [Pseudomonadota bacterium]
MGTTRWRKTCLSAGLAAPAAGPARGIHADASGLPSVSVAKSARSAATNPLNSRARQRCWSVVKNPGFPAGSLGACRSNAEAGRNSLADRLQSGVRSPEAGGRVRPAAAASKPASSRRFNAAREARTSSSGLRTPASGLSVSVEDFLPAHALLRHAPSAASCRSPRRRTPRRAAGCCKGSRAAAAGGAGGPPRW